jgi:hypothetical protein
MEKILIDEGVLGKWRERVERKERDVPKLYIVGTDSVVKWQNKERWRQGEDIGRMGNNERKGQLIGFVVP